MEYGGYNVNEKYSPIVAPNFYFDAVFQPGLTYSDQYQGSLSARRVWIEILSVWKYVRKTTVTLCEDSVPPNWSLFTRTE